MAAAWHVDVEQNEQVQDPDQDQEAARDDSSDCATDAPKLAAIGDDALDDPPDGKT